MSQPIEDSLQRSAHALDDIAFQLGRLVDLGLAIYKKLYSLSRPGPVSIRIVLEQFPLVGDVPMDLIGFVVAVADDSADQDIQARKVKVTLPPDLLLPPNILQVQERVVDGNGAGETPGGGDPNATPPVPPDPASVFWAPQGTTVHITTTSLDDASPPNESNPREQDKVIADTIAPAQPGEVEVRSVLEDHVPDPTP